MIVLFLVLLLPMTVLSLSDSPTFVMGIMSMAKDRDRRDAMRETWTKNLKDADDLKAFFVLGRLEKDHKEKIEKEMEEFGDIVVLDCVENQHKGKTILWFEHVYRNTEFDFAVKVDQDVYVWVEELKAHIKALPRENFYGGHGPLYTNRRYWRQDKFAFFNGGFAILSRDLVGEVARVVSIAKEHQTEDSKKNGYVIDTESLRKEHDIDLRGNEDVSLGRIFKPRLLKGTLKLNGGKGKDAADFPWSLRNHGPIPNTPAPGEDVSLRTCPWRHSKDLKTAKGYRLYHEMYGGVSNSDKDCRCNCRPLDEILKVAPVPKRKLPPHLANQVPPQKRSITKKKDVTLMKMNDIKSRNGARLNVKFHHKTDGIGGHVKMNFPVFAAAELFDLPIQCDNAALYNGHMSKTNPHIGNKLLLGCDENEISSWSRTVSKNKEDESKFKSWYDVFEISEEVDFNVYGNRCGKQAPTPEQMTTLKIPSEASKRKIGPPAKYLLRAGASFLRQGFVANTKPDEIASKLWEEDGEECFRVAIHWRTAMWSIRGMGTQGSVGEKFNKILARMVVMSKNPPSCVRVALITQRKEDETGQREVMKSIKKMKKNIKKLSAQFDIRVKAYISDSSKSVYDKSTELGGDPVDALIQDLALLTTSHLMLCGKSQFTNMAAMLQRTDGVHVVTTDKDFSTLQEEGPRNMCQYLPNTVLAKDLDSRLTSASKQDDPLKAFLELPSSTKTCPDFDGTPVELFHHFGDCDEMDLPPRGKGRGGPPPRRNGPGPGRRRPPPQNFNRRREPPKRRGRGGSNKPRIQMKRNEKGRRRRIQHEGL